uniref:Antigen 5-related protein n=1 Tax=Phlebotomus arabicus TaxID=578135 RepID=C6FX64_9DIPT
MLQIKHFLFFVLFVVVHSNDYCQPKLCTNGQRVSAHIGCKNDGKFVAGNCPNDAQMVNMSPERKNLFLKIHNRLRDRFARGSVPNYKSAAKMPMLKWDNELARLAEYNVRTCNFAHDQCRATKACPYAGQNLGQMLSSPDYLAPEYVIKNITREWFLEYQWANQARTDYFMAGSGKDGKQIGHFTAFVHEKSDKVGCAVAKLTNRQFDMKQYLVACNYCYTNMQKEKIYTTGKPCSQCQSKKCDTTYKSLCDANEKVDPIPDIFKQRRRT